MTVSTLSAAANITPVVIRTLYLHSKRKRKGKKTRSEDKAHALDNIFFDEAFNIVKAFILLGTKNTVESLQAFTNTHVPAPPWAAVVPVLIPFASCNTAADTLIKWFGPEDIKHVVGGERWWQVRGLDGGDGEWIAEKEQLTDTNDKSEEGKHSWQEKTIKKMEQLDRVLFYVHGGGYFWGSINTHRYQIIRYARMINGRAFAVNYRKAPQYPWPCPLQDVLAAYLYLIDPPPGSAHRPVPASKIVFAGDSAGGGLCLATLTLLRDMGLPMPAGAVLISPWVDMTHSFPSIMQNTHTDIIPPHGFLAKPSTLWPMDPTNTTARVVPTTTNPPPKPGHADVLVPQADRPRDDADLDGAAAGLGATDKPKPQAEMMKMYGAKDDVSDPFQPSDDKGESSPIGRGPGQVGAESNDDNLETREPKPSKVLMKDPNAIPLELRSQIHLYATNEQLSHPLVSPVLQSSLCNLCPLYIIAGDGEVLRDEVIYLAHRAAHPDQFPVREGVIRDGWRQKENLQRFTTPTKVHLQVFDDMCHVLTVFTFIDCANYAYHSIADFVKHVTDSSPEELEENPFPGPSKPSRSNTVGKTHPEKESQGCRKADTGDVAGDITADESGNMRRGSPIANGGLHPGTIETGKRGQEMIRERVDIYGNVRPMEPMQDVQALQLKPSEIGIIKEDPLNKWLSGQKQWDKRFKKTSRKVLGKRLKCETKAKTMIDNARDQGLVLEGDKDTINTRPKPERSSSTTSVRTIRGAIQADRRWGPLDLAEENPPSTAIANRRDTADALSLLKKTIYHSAPVTHKTLPTLKTSDAIKAAFDPNDDPFRPPRQSASEQQTRSFMNLHGLSVWESLIRLFIRKSAVKVANGTR
ncbi:alpha beta-hydrolase [Coniophora puteana RWD-64-598 SS2]|uniref:Alpha beta-hydrolase n=1 Tax=Coniophora puteana (strain RWD-64-598) TaxID=741705 RepID=A0A5M3MUS2_CONPW|nr:alpha beta-hydrolase [Coniophora puteana RWD-64-598 SS2]EIW82351.1 alpha beta-hydrolase [Coniophora puteana RWD-64-598 SS2]